MANPPGFNAQPGNAPALFGHASVNPLKTLFRARNNWGVKPLFFRPRPWPAAGFAGQYQMVRPLSWPL